MDLSEVIISSRIRLARNLKQHAFPHMQSLAESNDVIDEVFQAFSKVGNFAYYKLKNLSYNQANLFLEENVISKDLVKANMRAGLIKSEDETVSIMVNEEDTLRMQCIVKGLSVEKAYDIMSDIDAEVSKYLSYAYTKELGYLTACPTNVGTGIRASVMMFLPALTMSNMMRDVIDAVNKLGITVRGAGGESSKASGYLYQVSNQVTLGKTEKDIIALVERTVNKIYELEQSSRKEMFKKNNDTLIDDCYRAFGILTNSYMLSVEEYFSLSAKVKLGEVFGVLKLKNSEVFTQLDTDIKPFHILQKYGKHLTDEEQKIKRAELVAETLRNQRIYN